MTAVRDDRSTRTTTGKRRDLRWLPVSLGIVVFLALTGPVASLAGKATEVQKNDNAAYLPTSAESTKVNGLAKRFEGQETIPAVVVYVRDTGLTDADLATIRSDL